MRLNELLGANDISLVEETYAALKDAEFSKYVLREMQNKPLNAIAQFIRSGGSDVIAIAFNNDGFWTLVTDVVQYNAEFEQCAAHFFTWAQSNEKLTFSIDKRDLHTDILTLLSNSLLNGDHCTCQVPRRSYAEAYSSDRQARIQSLFTTYIEQLYDIRRSKILEICCGNGMGTAALRALGYDIFALDNDKCSICEGLYYSALERGKTVVLDASRLSTFEFFTSNNFDCVVGFMLGSIYEFNKWTWQAILTEAAAVVRKGIFIFTVHQQEEADFVCATMTDLGVNGNLMDNRDDAGIYDQWIYTGFKE